MYRSLQAETNEYYFDIVPIELYNKENFKKKLYLDTVVTIVQTGFEKLQVSKLETIEICRGYMFDKLKPWLDTEGYCWYGTHITGRIQEIVEKNFELYAIKLGLPEDYIKYTHYPFHFHKLLRWVFADYKNRIVLCKNGWKSWSKLENIKIECHDSLADLPNLFCLKCGKPIPERSKVKVLTYISNKENYIYLHDYCYAEPK